MKTAARLGAMLLLGLLAGLAQRASAGTITVNDTTDAYGGSTCSLRNAVRSIDTGTLYGGCHFSGSFGLHISLPAGTYRITRQPDPNDVYAGGGFTFNVGVFILGAGPDNTIVDGGGIAEIFKFTGNAVFVSIGNLQLTGSGGQYGAITETGKGVNLAVDRVLARRNHAGYGGSALWVDDSTGVVSMTHSTLSDNDADAYGGAIELLNFLSLTMENTTVSGNRSDFVGGILVDGGAANTSIRFNNVTISGNTGTRSDLPNNQYAEGAAGLFIREAFKGSIHMSNSILAGNSSHGRTAGSYFNADCYGASITSDDYNLFGFALNTYCTVNGSTLHSFLSADPKLLSLFDYGGGLPTQAIPPDSPAHNNGNPQTCASDDARGTSRTLDTCDIGAYELHVDYTVNSTLDANDAVLDGSCDASPPNHVCTLRAALDEANAAASFRTILLPAGRYTLSVPFGGGGNHGELDVINPQGTLILGAGADKTSIGWVAGRPSFVAATPAFALAHLAIARAVANQNNGVDGSVSLLSSNALLEEVSITHARNCQGGAVDIRSTPAGLYSLRVERSTLAYNSALGCFGAPYVNSGGAISSQGADLYLRNSTLSHNRADNSGGAIFATNSTVYLSADTIADNVADAASAGQGRGGGIALDPGSGGSFVLAATMLARNTRGSGAPDDCAALLASRDQNFIGNSSGCTITGSTFETYRDADPLLGALAHQGGPTMTHGLLADSPVLNWINERNCVDVFGNALAVDQRGVARTPYQNDYSTNCEIGAFEGVTDVIFADAFE